LQSPTRAIPKRPGVEGPAKDKKSPPNLEGVHLGATHLDAKARISADEQGSITYSSNEHIYAKCPCGGSHHYHFQMTEHDLQYFRAGQSYGK